MNTKPNAGPAFPVHDDPETFTGMELRDYFAAKAMQAILARDLPTEFVAEYAYEMADAMVAEREK